MKLKEIMSAKAFETLTDALLEEEINENTKYFQLKFFHQLSKKQQWALKGIYPTPLDMGLHIKMALIYGEKYDFDTQTQNKLEGMSMSALFDFIGKQKKLKGFFAHGKFPLSPLEK